VEYFSKRLAYKKQEDEELDIGGLRKVKLK